MTDNVTIDTAGALDRDAELALDQVTRGGVLEDEQVIKIALGADGDFDCLLDSGQQTMAQSVPVAIASNQSAVPVSGPVTNAELRAAPVPVSVVTLPLPAGAAIAARQPALVKDRVPVVLTTAAGVAVEPAPSDDSKNYVSGTALTPKWAAIHCNTNGDNTIVAAVVDRKIRVLSVYLVAAGAVTARFESGASGTALSGQMSLAQNGGFVLPFNPAGWFETAAGALLNLELGGAVYVDGTVQYVEVP
jgi:hypothetical protein